MKSKNKARALVGATVLAVSMLASAGAASANLPAGTTNCDGNAVVGFYTELNGNYSKTCIYGPS